MSFRKQHKKPFLWNFLLSFLFGFLFFTTPFFVSAQGFASLFGFSSEQFFLHTTPRNPNPNESVTVTLKSSALLPTTQVQWFVNGELKKEGVREQSIQVKTGGVGEATKIQVVVGSGENTATKTLVLNPGIVDILWEAQTYTPPFYRGKALPSSRTPLTLVAIPYLSGGEKVFSNDSLIYNWYQNYGKRGALSGYGQQTATIQSDFADGERLLKVVVVSPGGGPVAERKIEIPSFQPEILFYPLGDTGILTAHAMGNDVFLKQGLLKIVAKPFYFPFSSSVNNPGEYTWQVNNEDHPPSGEKNVLFLKTPEQSGEASISLIINNPTKLLQRAENQITLHF